MTFSYSVVWDDTARLLREHGRLLAAIAGVFLFFPALLVAIFFPPPEMADPALALQLFWAYYLDTLPWFLLQAVVAMVGSAAMLRLIFARGVNVGGALRFGATLLPFYFLLTLATGLIVGIGFLLLIVPGLYLIGRLAPATVIMVAENRRNPTAAISRAFALTEGKGWAVFGLVFVVGLIGSIVLGVASMIASIAFLLTAGQELARLLGSIVEAAFSALFATVMLMLYAAIYRALDPASSVGATFD